MDSDVLLHPATKFALEQAMASGHHAFALVGPFGAGKGYLANKLAAMLLGANYKPHQILRVVPADQSIGIEDIRSLHAFLKLKSTGSNDIRRVIIIEDAQRLTIEAQNALLKTLEEPPIDTRVILTVTQTTTLRPTVYSRLQVIDIKACTLEQATDYFEKSGFDYKKPDIQKAYLISGGYMGLCASLLQDSEHYLNTAIKEAKQFLISTPYERMLQVANLAKSSEQATLFLFALKRVLSAAMKTSSQDIAPRLKHVYVAEGVLGSNPNLKLLLTDLALNL